MKAPKTRPIPDLPAVLAPLRDWQRAAFPDSPAGAVVVVPAAGLPAVVLPLAGTAVPACIAGEYAPNFAG